MWKVGKGVFKKCKEMVVHDKMREVLEHLVKIMVINEE